MKKVLIISYHYLDQTAIAAVRINGLAKYLPTFGWKPYVLTAKSKARSNQNVPVYETPSEDINTKWKRKLGFKANGSLKEEFNITSHKNKSDYVDLMIRLWGEVLAYPDNVADWKKSAIDLGEELINRERFDAIISTSGPATTNLVAKDLRDNYNIPWIADFRDLWTQNHYYRYSRIRKFFERSLEIRTLSCADALTTVSVPLAEKLKQLHKQRIIAVIPNGFDPAQKVHEMQLAKKFTITYTGALYRGRRDPEPLFQAISDLLSNGEINPIDLSVDFFGPMEEWLANDVRKYNLNKIVNIYNVISRKESIEMQRRSHMLLLLTWDHPEETGVYTGKIFDYLAAGRPILSIGVSGGVIEDLLRITGAGYHISRQEDLKRIILNSYHEYKSINDVKYYGINSEIDKFSHIEMARKFSVVLNEIIDNRIKY